MALNHSPVPLSWCLITERLVSSFRTPIIISARPPKPNLRSGRLEAGRRVKSFYPNPVVPFIEIISLQRPSLVRKVIQGGIFCPIEPQEYERTAFFDTKPFFLPINAVANIINTTFTYLGPSRIYSRQAIIETNHTPV